MTTIKHLELSSSSISGPVEFCEFKVSKTFNFRIEVSAFGAFRLRITPIKSKESEIKSVGPELLISDLYTTAEIEFKTIKLGKSWSLTYQNYCLEISSSPLCFKFFKDGKLILSSGAEALSYDDGRWGLSLDTKEDDIYGLGYLRPDIECTEISEGSLPYAWSTSGWGIYAASAHNVSYSFKDEFKILFSEDQLDLFVFLGNIEELFNQFNSLIGRAYGSPLLSSGHWLVQTKSSSLNEFINYSRKLIEEGYGIDTLKLSCPSVFVFEEDKPNFDLDEERVGRSNQLKSVLDRNKKHLSLPAFPAFLKGSDLFKHLKSKSWLLKSEDGEIVSFNFESNEYVVLNLHNKDAYKFWQDRVQQILNGLDASLSYSCDDYALPDLPSSYFVLLEHSLAQAQAKNKSPSEVFIDRQNLIANSSRSLGLSIDREISSFKDLLDVHREHIATQVSGVVTEAHKFRIKCTTQNENLFLRAVAYSLFSGGFAFIAEDEYLPINFSKEIQDKAKTLISWYYRLLPTYLGIIEDSSRTGLPVQRIMPIAFPDDEFSHDFKNQFMFGSSLLVAPIFDDSEEVEIYLPEGESWWDVNTGIKYEGGQLLSYHCPNDSIPLFGRDGHMLCLGPELKRLADFNSAKVLDEVWLFGMPVHSPQVIRNKIRIMQMQGSSYIKGFEGLKILPSQGLVIKRRGAEVRISPAR